jgi:hypothetical protein
MKPPSPFSLLASGAAQRLAGAAVLIAGLWLAVFWALQ